MIECSTVSYKLKQLDNCEQKRALELILELQFTRQYNTHVVEERNTLTENAV